MNDTPDALADLLVEYRKIKYMGNCKCGNCQLIPLDFIDRVIIALRTTPVLPGPPSHDTPRFIEVENVQGRSIKFGEWLIRRLLGTPRT